MASYEETLVSITLDAHEDLAVDTRPPYVDNDPPAGGSAAAGYQYRFVQVSGPHQAALFNGATGAIPVGVLQNKPQVTDMACTVGISGISLVEAGGEVTAGAAVEADATGRAVAASGGPVVGIAIYGSDEAGQLIPVLLRLTGTAVPA